MSEEPQDRVGAWMVLHPRMVFLAWGLSFSLLVIDRMDGMAQFVVVAAIVVGGQVVSTRWQGWVLRRSGAAKAARREHFADWYRRHPDHDPPDWLRSE